LFRHFAIGDLQLLAAPYGDLKRLTAPTAIHQLAQHGDYYSAMVPT
jgi:hypothetical protein